MSISPRSHISDSLATPADPRVWHQRGFPWLQGRVVPPAQRAAAVLPRGILPRPPPQPQGFPFHSVPLRARFLKYLLFQEGVGCLEAAELRSVFAFALSAFPKHFSHRATQHLSPLARTLLFPVQVWQLQSPGPGGLSGVGLAALTRICQDLGIEGVREGRCWQ